MGRAPRALPQGAVQACGGDARCPPRDQPLRAAPSPDGREAQRADATRGLWPLPPVSRVRPRRPVAPRPVPEVQSVLLARLTRRAGARVEAGAAPVLLDLRPGPLQGLATAHLVAPRVDLLRLPWLASSCV